MGSYVLIVDDNSDVQTLVMDVLEALGIEGREVHNGRQAVAMVQQNPPAAIVLDLMMPIADGFTTLIHLQGNRTSRQIPIIVLSSLIDGDRYVYRFPGVIGVMSKGNFSIEGFHALLKEAGIAA